MKVVSIRHPMPYGDLVKQKAQRFATYEDPDKYKCIIEEREEYKSHIDGESVIYTETDYGRVTHLNKPAVRVKTVLPNCIRLFRKHHDKDSK